MQLSKLESKAFDALSKNNLVVFKTKDLMLLLDINRVKSYNLIKALKKKRAIEAVRAGLYVIRGTDELVVGSYLNWPSYLSFWSALSYYGFTDQLPKTTFYASTKYRKRINNYQYITILKKRFFGYKKIGNIVIAEKEKAIIDSLLFPKYAGGIREITCCIEKYIDELDKNKLVEYAIMVESNAVLRRLGFILELTGCKEGLLDKIRREIGRGYELLDPSLDKKNNLNKKWLLDVNDDIKRRA